MSGVMTQWIQLIYNDMYSMTARSNVHSGEAQFILRSSMHFITFRISTSRFQAYCCLGICIYMCLIWISDHWHYLFVQFAVCSTGWISSESHIWSIVLLISQIHHVSSHTTVSFQERICREMWELYRCTDVVELGITVICSPFPDSYDEAEHDDAFLVHAPSDVY